MKKRLLVMLLAVIMVAGLLPGTAWAMPAVRYQAYTDTNAFGWTFRDEGDVVPATLEFEAVKMIYETVSIDEGDPQYVSLYLVKPGSSVTSADGAETTFSYEGVGANYLGNNTFSLDPWYVEVNWSAKTMTAEEFFAGGEDGDRFDALWVYDRENSFGYIIMLESFYDVTVPSEPEPTEPGTPTFTDVPAGSWYENAVAWAVENKITSGTNADSTTFSPTKTCTEVEILTFLWRAAGKPAAEAQAPVTAEPYLDEFQSALNWAYELKMIDGSFDSTTPCTRASAVKYIWQALGSHDAAPSSFTDVSPDAGYADAVNWAVDNGVVMGTGDGTTFSPDMICDRSQIVTFLQRAYA